MRFYAEKFVEKPNIEGDNLPRATFKREDAQLDAAVEL
jgi:hypothetical protein